MKQVRFDGGCCNSKETWGIILDNGDIICGRCGNVITRKMQEETPDFKLLRVLDYWVDLSDAIAMHL